MAKKPIGKLDHIGIAVKSIAEARKFYEGELGATFIYEHANEEEGFKYAEFDLGGTVIELLESLRDDSFLHKFIEQRGEGFHHITFGVPGARERIAELKADGVRMVDETEHSPESHEAFVSPRSSHGVLIQLGSSYPTLALDPQWEKEIPGLRLDKFREK